MQKRGMNCETLLVSFRQKLLIQRYAQNTVNSYVEYAKIFLDFVKEYNTLQEVPISVIESFINQKVLKDKISVSYQKALVGAIRKLYLLKIISRSPL